MKFSQGTIYHTQKIWNKNFPPFNVYVLFFLNSKKCVKVPQVSRASDTQFSFAITLHCHFLQLIAEQAFRLRLLHICINPSRRERNYHHQVCKTRFILSPIRAYITSNVKPVFSSHLVLMLVLVPESLPSKNSKIMLLKTKMNENCERAGLMAARCFISRPY